MVGGTGIEPVAPSMSRKCSPAELTAPPSCRGGFYSGAVRGGQVGQDPPGTGAAPVPGWLAPPQGVLQAECHAGHGLAGHRRRRLSAPACRPSAPRSIAGPPGPVRHARWRSPPRPLRPGRPPAPSGATSPCLPVPAAARWADRAEWCGCRGCDRRLVGTGDCGHPGGRCRHCRSGLRCHRDGGVFVRRGNSRRRRVSIVGISTLLSVTRGGGRALVFGVSILSMWIVPGPDG